MLKKDETLGHPHRKKS